ncbi:MAG: phosphoglyceromutase [Sediminibacterium sp.]|nr:phosphoglyceromutase [Sediminibacterium sp.]
MKRNLLLPITFIVFSIFTFNQASFAQQTSENLIIVTLDGMRWQEIFTGADKELLTNKKFTKDSAGSFAKYWRNDAILRREILFPFIWKEIAKNGQIIGNRKLGNNFNNANPYKFSYPGYNEIFTGYPDTAVNSNDKIVNKNTTVLEFLNQQKNFTNKIAAFTTWDVFPYILNTWRSGVYVNTNYDTLSNTIPGSNLINEMTRLSPRPIGVRPDVLTYFAAKTYLQSTLPRVLYIAFDETDDYAHAGNYNQYLISASAQDNFLADLWNWIQHNPIYKDKTTLIVTCDHGRGDTNKENWQHHGEKIPEAGEIWMAAIGPNIAALGERKDSIQLYQKQLAATFAKIVGLTFTANHPVGEPIESIFKK